LPVTHTEISAYETRSLQIILNLILLNNVETVGRVALSINLKEILQRIKIVSIRNEIVGEYALK